MKTKDLQKKYNSAIKSVAIANNVDMGVGYSMLVHEYYAHIKANGRTHKYKGVPVNFDWNAFGRDLKTIEVVK